MIKKEQNEISSNESKYFKCPCNQLVNYQEEQSLKNHIKNCATFKKNSPISSFYYRLKLKEFNVSQLKAIEAELGLILENLAKEIQMRDESHGEPMPPKKERLIRDFPNNDPKSLNGNNGGAYTIDISQRISMLKEKNNNEYVKCGSCKIKLKIADAVFLAECDDIFCKTCFASHIANCFNQSSIFKCSICNVLLSEKEVRDIIGEDEFNKFEEDSLDINITECIKCKLKCVVEPESIVVQTLIENKSLIPESDEKLSILQNRFVCPKCKTDQCLKCKASPYHKGKLCERDKKILEKVDKAQGQAKNVNEKSENINYSKVCKYCGDSISNNVPGFPDICTKEKCKDKTKVACTKTLKCGHSCCGFRDEEVCLPCIVPDCIIQNPLQSIDQTGNDLCTICFTESLLNAPCIQSKCGHIVHFICITEKLAKKWLGPRITFSFCLCPTCETWLEFPRDSPLQLKINEYKRLYNDISKKCMERLKHDGYDKDKRLEKKEDQYYKKPQEYAFALYSHYQCFKCKKPYFGGMKKCEELKADEIKEVKFKPEELICAACSSKNNLIGKCRQHGTEFVDFKCRYCCSIAQWFYSENTHLCDSCYQKQLKGENLARKSKSQLQLCKSKSTCPLKIDHQGNGEELVLKCLFCYRYN